MQELPELVEAGFVVQDPEAGAVLPQHFLGGRRTIGVRPQARRAAMGVDFACQVAANLWRNKLRSFLTLFGIAWGIASMVLFSALTEGFRQGQRRNIAQLADRAAFVFPGRTELQAGGARAGRGIFLTWQDVEAVRLGCPAIEIVTGEVKNWEVDARSAYNAGRFLTVGVSPDYLKLRHLPVGQGRSIRQADVKAARRVAVLGAAVREQLFPRGRPALHQNIYLNGQPYVVVGILDKKNQSSSYDGWDNDKILIPAPALVRDVPPSLEAYATGRVQAILYRARDPRQWKRAQQQVREVLGRRHGFDPRDQGALYIWDTVEDSELFDQIFVSMELFLATIALVTLSLGGVGVMNTMSMTVAERTQEIGLKMALGATRRRILKEFLLEGVVIALLGGGLGFGLVAMLAGLVNSLSLPEMFAGLPVHWSSVLGAAVILGVVAVLAALPPAWQASQLTPVEALRYEV